MPAQPTINYTADRVDPLFPQQGGVSSLKFMPNTTYVKGRVLGQVSSASASEVQTLTFAGAWAAGDTITISIVGIDGGAYSTDDMVLSAVPSVLNATLDTQIEAMLLAAGYVGATVTIAAGPIPANTTITFGGTLANKNVPLMTVASVVAGNGTVTLTTTTPGLTLGLWGWYDDTVADGRQVARAINQYTFRTDYAGRVIFGTGTPLHADYYESAPAYFKGRFATTDLVGLDANGIADFGRLESGTAADGVLALI